MTTDEALRVLTRAECLRALRDVHVGRVIVPVDDRPAIVPVHFHVDDDDRIVIETRPGSDVHAGTDDTVVAFEAEGPAVDGRPAWTVTVRGVASHPRPWARLPDPDRTVVRLTTDDVHGRQAVGDLRPWRPARPKRMVEA